MAIKTMNSYSRKNIVRPLIIFGLVLVAVYCLVRKYQSHWLIIGSAEVLQKRDETFLILEIIGQQDEVSGWGILRAIWQWNTQADTDAISITASSTTFLFQVDRDEVRSFQIPIRYASVAPTENGVYIVSGTYDDQKNFVIDGNHATRVKRPRSEIYGNSNQSHSEFLRTNGWESTTINHLLTRKDTKLEPAQLDQPEISWNATNVSKNGRKWDNFLLSIGRKSGGQRHLKIISDGKWEIVDEAQVKIASGNVFESMAK